jgi:hypothetical protein
MGRTQFDSTPLDAAASNGRRPSHDYAPLCTSLLEKGAEVNTKDHMRADTLAVLIRCTHPRQRRMRYRLLRRTDAAAPSPLHGTRAERPHAAT